MREVERPAWLWAASDNPATYSVARRRNGPRDKLRTNGAYLW